ncbi:MAG: alpha-2-macroglobulin [Chloracidobacterium sp.]|nr:alpha-2-macroglobulin [Chloracidobacterium sp.]
MKPLVALILLSLLCFASPQSQQSNFEDLKTEAERLYAEASYSQARELYLKARGARLQPEDARWVEFRLADTLWRAQSATQTADSTKYETAQRQLESLIRERRRTEDHDRIWAEAQESLGDFWWTRRDTRNWGDARQHYQQALDWWAGTKDLDLGRSRYLKIVWTMAQPPHAESNYLYGNYGNVVPLEILDNALKIAQNDADRARAHYLIAMTLRYRGGDYRQMQRAPEEFEAAIKLGKASDWYDDGLYYYAEWITQQGRYIPLDNGGWRQEHDYVKALELFRRLVTEYSKGETRYYDQAQQQIENITKPVVGVSVTNVFLPDSEIQINLNWRNVNQAALAIYPVNLPRDARFEGKSSGQGNWIQRIDLSGSKKLREWNKDIADKGDYQPGQETIRLNSKLPTGAYVIEARNGDVVARDLLLVSDAALVLKSSGKQALAYFCDALSGAPLARATVKLGGYYSDGKDWIWRESVKETNQDGIALFDLNEFHQRDRLVAVAAGDNRQAFSAGYSYYYNQNQQSWRIYAFTDRPAYRPNEVAQWKFIARKYQDSVYSTPANQTIAFGIYDPRGAKVKEGKAELNAFGSAWGSLELTERMPLGEYRIDFWNAGHDIFIGQATLFRLEEYKIPEFQVSVQTPEEKGRKKAFLLGDKVEVNVQADYYFGGPVANATVEILVHQNPFYHWWYPQRDYQWYYDDLSPRYWYGGRQGQIIKREKIRTDAAGKATLAFDTPRDVQQDFEYYIEARVTDSSRREIVGNGSVRVTRQRYYVYPRAKHKLYRPLDKVAIDLEALDANNQPMQTEGTVKVTRDTWDEIWLDPKGREVKGAELKKLREKGFSPPGAGWRLRFQGYKSDDILTQSVKTNADGQAEFNFTPEREGYYRVAWSSPDKGSMPIKAETTVWVTTNATTELGYRHSGLEIIVDQDTFRAGQKAPVMINAPAPDRYVLFSVESENLHSYQLVHLAGTVKLIEVPIEERHTPNVFLNAAMVSDRQFFTDSKPIIVPPARNFLTVEVKPDREQYEPREEGKLTVTTRDHEGQPVSAEVALGLTDESINYIQQDYAGDPRQFYYGMKRQLLGQTQSTFQQKSYAKLVEGADKKLIDERERISMLRDRDQFVVVQDRWREGTVREEESEQVGQSVIAASPISARAAQETADRASNGSISIMNRTTEAEANAERLSGSLGELTAVAEFGRGGAKEPGQEPAVQVRSDFRSTVFWQPDVVTDKDGKAVVKVKFPDSLTRWRATARVATEGNQFGVASATARTKQPLIVRLQAPRFFVAGDLATVSAVINNNTDQPMIVAPSLSAEGVTITGAPPDGNPVEVKANGEARIDWMVAAQQAGNAKLKVTARDGKHADAMERDFTVHEHGIEKLVARSGKLRGDDITVKLDLPKERDRETTMLTVQITPSMAVTMLDALPYLIDYPYGCTEQTMSRFLPAAITAKTLKDLNLNTETVMSRMFGGVEPEYADKTHPKGNKNFQLLDDMIKQSLDRLYNFQHSDGGWGWWKEDDSDHFMTAYVVWGLTLAREAGVQIKTDVLERGVNFLDKEIVEEETSYDRQAWMLHALASYYASSKGREVGAFQSKAFQNLWGNREKLNAYTRALLALSAHYLGYRDEAKTLVRNLENGVKMDTAPDTSIIQTTQSRTQPDVISAAHWGEDGIYWRWSDGGVEATAFALRALLAIEPGHKLIEPVTNWLVKNRRGAQWSNTRDTAITVLTLNEYLRASGELASDLEYELLFNGQRIAANKITAADALGAPSRFEIHNLRRELLSDGGNEIRIKRLSGQGPIYFSAQARFFSREEPVAEAGNEIFVRRQYYKLVARPTLLKGYVYERELLGNGQTVKSGERVEAVITIEAKNNYEYLLFEDLKPAGLEAVELRSGSPLYAREMKSGAVTRKFAAYPEVIDEAGEQGELSPEENANYTGRRSWVYQELRDRKVALFIDKLPEGVWEIRYKLRAETPGRFHALPVVGHAMYAPEIRANGVETRLNVEDPK